ncbi:hypothetical protein [Porphyrobacter sp. YT40]|uniref:hypothetical protein n=1 Tax=Porphyrobacter sp. YT40 TaxID=2547601 RepID=UPI001142D963|nr:hypothetical protein [Porphyrobacter sp. YT40]QDH33915.1 hypothetical protein E2E27_05950 [Porphyrobacter sp. YT40]
MIDIFTRDTEGFPRIGLLKGRKMRTAPTLPIASNQPYRGLIKDIKSNSVPQALVAFGAIRFLARAVWLQAQQMALKGWVRNEPLA